MITLTSLQFSRLMGMLPNPLAHVANSGNPLVDILFDMEKEPTEKIILQKVDTDGRLHKMQHYNNRAIQEIRFKINIYDSQIPFWECVEEIHIVPFNFEKEKALREKISTNLV